MTDWRSSLRSDPTPWLLENASAPIRYRVLTELLDHGRDDPDVQKARHDIAQYGPAVQLQRKQRKDGSWGGRIHAGDSRKLEPSLENLMNKLFEYGWRREAKPVQLAAKTLRTFLTSKKDLKLFHVTDDPEEAAEIIDRHHRRRKHGGPKHARDGRDVP